MNNLINVCYSTSIMNKREAKKLDENQFYVDYDAETDCWGVFGELSEFCYALFGDKDSADRWQKKNQVSENK